jgi:hypothetical protein
MERVLVYAPGAMPRAAVAALSGYEIVQARTRLELTEKIVDLTPLLCLIVGGVSLEGQLREFLFALSRSFPVLEVCVVMPGGRPPLPEGYRHLDGSLAEAALQKALADFVSSVTRKERRGQLRYDWPLQGHLSADGKRWQPYRVRALSSGGAFLEHSGPVPDPGTRLHARIAFQEHALTTECVILPTRLASSNLPPGFGIRFADLEAPARALIDRIVRDALVRSLLEPEAEPQMPSLGEEELLQAGFRRL